MTRVAHAAFGYVACCAWGVATCLAPAPATRPAARTGLEDEIASAVKVLLANPVDSATSRRLEKLRRQQERQNKQGLDCLGQGLDHYLNGRSALAVQALKRAGRSPYAVALAGQLLSSSLDEILDASEKTIGPEICPVCGDTGWADCRSAGCSGCGLKACPACKGTGYRDASRRGSDRGARRRPPPGPTTACDRCKGTGSVPCGDCRGRGVVPCPRCTANRSGRSKPAIAPEAVEAVRKLIDLAGYLRDGGLDLYSPQALKRSPKLTE